MASVRFLLLVMLLLSVTFSVNRVASSPTFLHRDPVTGRSLQCDRCPPGTFLRARCSANKQSDCAPCPNGSFTELWNYVGTCLRCGVCGRNQVVKKECSASSDCQCECKPGYFYKKDYDMCVPHSECPSGRGVLTQGTAENDTVCHLCSNGSFSDISSGQHNCKQHKRCSDAGLHLILKPSTWHDSVCANCGELKEGAEYLKEIIPAFFVHHKMNIKKLRRIVHKLTSQNGRKQGGSLALSSSQLHAQIGGWASSATVTHILQLSDILIKVRARNAGEKLLKKLNQIKTHLTEKCSLGSVRKTILV